MNILMQPFYAHHHHQKKGGGGIGVANITDNHIMVAWFLKASMNVFLFWQTRFSGFVILQPTCICIMYSLNLTKKYILYKTCNLNITIQLLYIKKLASFSSYCFVHINIS